MTATGFYPMDTTGFYPMDTRADPDEIRHAANGLQSISGVLLGHGEAVGAVLSEVALSFSDVIAPTIAAQIGNNVAALEVAVEATEYGHVVGLDWAQDVADFKAARKALIARWEAAEMDDFGIPAASRGYPLIVDEARTGALQRFVLEGHELWESFQDSVIEKGRMFREGPTAENLALVVGYLGWGAMTLWPEIAPAPVSAADGVSDASTVIEGLDSTASPSTVIDALSNVAAIARRAAAGQELTPAEIDYLEAFYETMGERIAEVPDYLEQLSYTYTTSVPTSGTDGESPPTYSSHTVGPIELALIVPMTAAAANGMLVLSRNGPGGGGYGRLPTWVRDALDGDEPYARPPDPSGQPIVGEGSDFEKMVELGTLLEYSTVEGGLGFSRQLALATSDLIQIGTDAPYSFSPDVVDPLLADIDQTGRTFLNVVARNDEACYDLILDQDMPDGYDAETFFANVYGFEWSDDGASAAQLSGFILDWENHGSAEQSDRADLAMRGLVDLTTGNELFGTLMDEVGTSGDSAQSALGQANPAISAHLGELMVTYFAEFSGVNPSSPLSDVGTLSSVRFATLISTDDASASALGAQVDFYERELLGNFPQAAGVNEIGGSIGRINGIVNGGIMNASMDMLGDEQQAGERAYQLQQVALGLVESASGALPQPFSALVSAASVLIDDGNSPTDVVTPQDLDPEQYERANLVQRQYDTSGAVLQSLIDGGYLGNAELTTLREQGLVVGENVAQAPTEAISLEGQTDELVAAADAAASTAGLEAPSVQQLLEHIQISYNDVVEYYRAENPAEYEERIEG